MPLEPHERAEIDRLWTEHNAQAAVLTDQQTRLRLFEERLERMSTDAANSNGKVEAQLTKLADNLLALDRSLNKFEVQQDTRGGLVDRWLPLLISALCAVAVVKDLLN